MNIYVNISKYTVHIWLQKSADDVYKMGDLILGEKKKSSFERAVKE